MADPCNEFMAEITVCREERARRAFANSIREEADRLLKAYLQADRPAAANAVDLSSLQRYDMDEEWEHKSIYRRSWGEYVKLADVQALLANRTTAADAGYHAGRLAGLEEAAAILDNKYNRHFADTWANEIRALKDRATAVGAGGLPDGWKVERVGSNIHLTRADGKWCGYSMDIDSPAHQLTYGFLKALLADRPTAKGAAGQEGGAV
ncbi:hypothetical protein [Massilia alkalitolerans]|uniref:hypothetical protein n=1 Tax=Massilia alkalitolerans TaxID=286638 RepID=UPI00042195C3|nr:hypothetical protein [Massilia alkalitolerans]